MQSADAVAAQSPQSLSLSRLAGMVAQNAGFVASRTYEHVADPHRKREAPYVVVTCMDTRLLELLPRAMGMRRGDAKVIRNAGGMISTAFGGVMRSVLVAIYELEADEVYVVGVRGRGAG